MSRVQVSEIQVSFGDRDVLQNVHLALDNKSRTALTGANGSGKTTLMRIIAGLSKPDFGERTVSEGARVAYLPQSGVRHEGLSLYEEVEKAFSDIRELIRRRDELGDELQEASPEDGGLERKLHEFHELQERVDASGYYQRDSAIDTVLSGLGFKREQFSQPTDTFSGGWQMRIALAKVLLTQPDVLLLDEPTNYLDIEARLWLLSFLRSFAGGVLLVSHDRYFLDQTVTEVAELYLGRLSVYRGNFTAYEKRRTQELEELLSRYEQQQREIAKLEEFISRFRSNESKASLVQSRIKQLEKIDRIEIPEGMKRIHFSFPPPPHSGKLVVESAALRKQYGEHLVLDDVELTVTRGEKVAIVGPNGAGKTTLLRILAGVDSAYEGNVRLGSGVQIGYFAQDVAEQVGGSTSVYDRVAELAPTDMIPKVRSLLGAFLFRGDDVFKPLEVLSGGERNRVAMVELLLRPVNLLILDEPTNHLDMTSKDVLLEALEHFPGTVLFVSHDRYFSEKLAQRVMEVVPGGDDTRPALRDYPGGYDYYLYRSGLDADLAPDASPARQTSAAGEGSSATESGKPAPSREEQRKQRSRLKKLERQEEELLGKLEANEERQREIEAQMALPEAYADGERMRRLKADLEAARLDHEGLSGRWAEVDGELSTLRDQS